MQNLVKGQFEWHNTINANFHELDSGKVNNGNLAELVGYGVVTGLEVLAQETPNMTVKVNAGIVYMPGGNRLEFAGNDSVAISPADAENPRVDIVYINTDGTVGYIAGVPFTTPIAPDTPEGAFLLAKINVAVGTTTIIGSNITDMRKIKNNLDEHVVKKATQTDLGHVKKGTDINIDSSGVISVDSGNTAGKILKLPAGLTNGDMLYVNSSGQLVRLPKGGEAQALLTLDGKPTWGTGMASSKVFDTPGTYPWTVPAGVKVVKATGCAAGGGGGGGSAGYDNTDWGANAISGSAGGVTSFGTLFTLNGGIGGHSANGTLGGVKGDGGTIPINIPALFALKGNDGTKGNDTISGHTSGAAGVAGANGMLGLGLYGKGGDSGAGGIGNTGGASGGSGGAGAAVNGYVVPVTPGDTINITIGAGGGGGAGGVQNNTSFNGFSGADGGNGILIIEW